MFRLQPNSFNSFILLSSVHTIREIPSKSSILKRLDQGILLVLQQLVPPSGDDQALLELRQLHAVQMLMQAFLPDLNKSLGLYIPLIVVNCIILGRAEAFANKNTIIDSALDGLGMGIGFTLGCFVMGAIREILGSGMFMGHALGSMTAHPMVFFMLPAGGFLRLRLWDTAGTISG